MIQFNINNYVYVKLTDEGRKVYRDYYAYVWNLLKKEPHDPEVDSQGWSKFQMWSFMEMFGPFIHLCGPNLFEYNDVRFNEKDFEIVFGEPV